MQKQLIAIIFTLFYLSTWVNASTITVNTLDDMGSNSDGMCSLREAILAAGTNTAVDTCTAGEILIDTITIDPALIPIGGNPFRIDLQSSITITGGDLQIIGLINNTLELNGLQSNRILRVDMLDNAELHLSNLRLKDGQVSSAGAGIDIRSGVGLINLNNMELINNTSNQEGGGISTGVISNLQLFISNSTLSGNNAPRGGAISVTTIGVASPNLTVEISESKITNNTASNGSGGAIYVLPFDVSNTIAINVEDSLFELNTAISTGGAISAAGLPSVNNLSVNLFRNLFNKNFSNGSSGGALRSVNIDTIIVNNTFIENESEFSGGAMNLGNTSGDRQTIIVANTFYENSGGTGAPTTVAKEFDVRFTDTPNSINVFQGNLISTDLSNQSDDACFLSNTQAVTTVGYNVANDADCVVDASDITQSDLRLRVENGFSDVYPVTVRPLPNSVAIDHWDESDCLFDGSPLQNDMTGLRRDNVTGMAFDGDTDENFDCDAGAFEAPSANRLDISISGAGFAYEVNYDINCITSCTMPVPANEDLLLIARPSVNSIFDQWTGACIGALNGPCGLNINQQTAVGLEYSNVASTSVLNVDKIGNGLVTSDVMGIYCGEVCRGIFEHNSMINLTATPQLGSIFTGWSGGICTGMGLCTVTIDDAVTQTVQATFTNQTYTLDASIIGTGIGTVISNPLGIECTPDCTEDFPAGTMVELFATPTGNDVFVGFTGDCTGPTCLLTMNQNQTVTAEFQSLKTLNVTINGTGQVTSDPEGIDCPGNCSLQDNQFSSYTLTAIETVPDQIFLGWQGDCTPTGDGSTCVTSLIVDSDVTARFAGDAMFANGFE